MDAEILFPKIRLFGSSKVCSSNTKSNPTPKISKARRRKIRLMKNSMVSSSFHIRSDQTDGDGSFLDNNGVEAHSSALAGDRNGSPALSDSVLLLPAIAFVPPVIIDSPVVMAVVQPQSILPHYNLRPRVPRLL